MRLVVGHASATRHRAGRVVFGDEADAPVVAGDLPDHVGSIPSAAPSDSQAIHVLARHEADTA